MSELTDYALSKLQALASMRSGDGVNDQVLICANQLRHEADSPEETKAIIRPYLEEARPNRSKFEIERELNRQVETSYNGFVKGEVVLSNNFKPKPKQPSINHTAIKRIASTGLGAYDLWERSPVRFDDDNSHSDEVIDGLFADNEYIAVSYDGMNAVHGTRDELRSKLSDCSHIVPSVMRMEGGLTKEGKHSFRCSEAVQTRPFLVVESDKLEKDAQAAVLWHLNEYLPLVLVVDSAGKSLHGWFYCESLDEGCEQHSRFIKYALSLGADPAAFRRGQYVRMPDGTRNNGARQAVIYWTGGVR